MASPSEPPSFRELLLDRRILVCVGSGGVGKTTIAATLALSGALLGRRTLVLTIDPARRLADALGLDALGHDIQRVPRDKLLAVAERRGVKVPESGSLDAMMLDQKRAFDEVVERYARDEGTRRKIFDNLIYKQVSSTLAGSHEYAAMSKLYEIAGGTDYDLIVLDTPPTENALDFLDAPQRVTQAIDSPAIQWLIKPYLTAGSFSLKLVGMGGAVVLKGLARFVGSQFLMQMAQFFVEFNQVLKGFHERANQVFELLQDRRVGFVLCASPEPLTIDEALYFHGRLVASKMPLGGFVVNRIHEQGPPAPARQELLDLLAQQPALAGFPADDLVLTASSLDRTYREQQILAAADMVAVERLQKAADAGPGATLRTVPLFEEDVYGVEGLALVNKYLLA